jgi:hypothetical protein
MVKIQSPRAVPQVAERKRTNRNANQWAEIDAGMAVSIPRSIIVSVYLSADQLRAFAKLAR